MRNLAKTNARVGHRETDRLVVEAPVGDGKDTWTLTMLCPDDSPYRGTTLPLSFKFPAQYPFEPPNVRVLKPIYHLNILHDGDGYEAALEKHSSVCHPVLHESGWSPAHDTPQVLKLIQELLSKPDPQSCIREWLKPHAGNAWGRRRTHISEWADHIADETLRLFESNRAQYDAFARECALTGVMPRETVAVPVAEPAAGPAAGAGATSDAAAALVGGVAAIAVASPAPPAAPIGAEGGAADGTSSSSSDEGEEGS
jgi:ubiquitin-protein ligase